MKVFAFIDFSANKIKKGTITDDNNIEISNLNKQFLYRNSNVDQSKSITAGEVVKEISPEFDC